MNTKQLFAAAAITLTGIAAQASEVTQFTDAAATNTRAQVRAELARATAAGELAGPSATYGYFEPRLAISVRSRDEVRAEARAFGRKHSFNALYVGA